MNKENELSPIKSPTDRAPPLAKRVLSGFALALAIALGTYLLMYHSVWMASLWFLSLLPALLCALICYIGDPDQQRPVSFYWRVPPALVAIVVVAPA